MGQRLQIFLHAGANPVIKLENKLKSLKEYNRNDNNNERMELKKQIDIFHKAFGKKHNSIVYALHSQWMYGRASLILAANALTYNAEANNYDNPFTNDNNFTAEEVINNITAILSLFTSKLAKKIGRYGIERLHLLNFSENYAKSDFTRFDNNDGCIILDLVNSKYCFINIGGDSTINQLPLLEPVSATRYVRLYYPETIEDSLCNQKAGTPEEIEAEYLQNKRLNRLFTKAFDGFEVLTKKELAKLFPDVYKVKAKTVDE